MNIDKAMKRARIIIESRYEDTCDIYEYKPVYDDKTKQTKPIEKLVYENKKCQLSYKKTQNNEEVDEKAKKMQIVELFISPDLRIKPGSKIVVTHKGVTTEYKNSGEPAIYNTQQTILLELFDGWS